MESLKFPSNPLDSWWPFIISLIIGLITFFRERRNVSCPTYNRIDGKIIVVTGASGGIGLEICKELARRGGHIVMCCQSLKKGLEAMKLIKKQQPDALLTLKKLDLTSRESIDNFSKCLGENQVDILINNAGIYNHPYKITDDGHEIHLATNYFGHFILTHLLLKNFKKSKQARIINICSNNYESNNFPLLYDPEPNSYIPNEWYRQSKLALILMTKYIAKILKDSRITINAVNPGLVRGTQYHRHSLLMKNWSVRISLAPWMWFWMKSPNKGAQTTIYLATDPLIVHNSGKLYSNCVEEKTKGKGNNIKEAEILYSKTCQLLNISHVEL